MTKGEAQRSIRTFYEVVKSNTLEANRGGMTIERRVWTFYEALKV
jgi:hypothetical protein